MHNIIFLPLVIIICVLHFIVLGIAKIIKHSHLERTSWISLVAFDRWCNTLIGGSHRETISSRLGRHKIKGCLFCGLLCKFLDLFEDRHCESSIERDEE